MMRIIFLLFVFVFCVVGAKAHFEDKLTEIPTKDIVIKLGLNVGPLKFASDHGLKYIGPYLEHVAKNLYHFRVKHSNDVIGTAGTALFAKLRAHGSVVWIEPQVATYKFPRADLSKHVIDPEFTKQWHLEGVPGVSLNIKAALKQGIDGKGTVIAIVDDGVEINHLDLRDRVNRGLCWDFNENHGTNCSPYQTDGHGTSAAGLAAASRNSVCGIGTGSGATIVGLRLLAGPTTDMVEATALSYKKNEIDIYSNSWGPIDDGKRFSGGGRLAHLALESGATTGRKGKGNIFVWAGGNGRQQKDDCNRDSYANSRHTIAVGAINDRGRTTYYSEPCAELMVVVPSSGDGRGLVTTDLTGSAGYSSGECTNKFGGTSGAAPQIAGVVANMLQLRKDLTKRDVEGILAKSAVRVNPNQPGWSKNARGYYHHHDYGFGRMEMERNLKITKGWTLMPAQKVCELPLTGINKKIPFAMGAYGGVITNIDVSSACSITFVEHIEIKTYIRHPRRGSVAVAITGPEGIVSKLAEPNYDYHSNYPTGGWTFGSVRHWGSRAQGRWSFSVYDSSTSHGHGVAEWVKLTIYGH